MNGIDFGKLETVMQFANFIELLKDPNTLSKMVSDAQKATSELKTLLGAQSTVEAANNYSKKIDADVKSKYDILETRSADLDARDVELAKAVKANNDQQNSKALELDAREKTVSQHEKVLADRTKTFIVTQTEFSQRLANVETREAALVVAEAQLATKVQKISDLVS